MANMVYWLQMCPSIPFYSFLQSYRYHHLRNGKWSDIISAPNETHISVAQQCSVRYQQSPFSFTLDDDISVEHCNP